MAVEISDELIAPAPACSARTHEGVSQSRLGIGDRFSLTPGWQSKRLGTVRTTRHAANGSLIENKPGLGHSDRDHRNDGRRKASSNGTCLDLGAASVGWLCFRIAMDERHIDRVPEAFDGFEPIRNGSAPRIQSGRVGRCDSHLDTALEAQFAQMICQREIGRAIGNENCTQRHATSNRCNCAPGGAVK